MRPKITIITVVLNAQDSIAETIESVLHQTYIDYEHLIFDGLSKDKTAEIVHSYQSPRIRFMSRKDKGIYDAMNQAIVEAQGEWLYFLNAADTFKDSTTLERLLADGRYDKQDLISGYVLTKNDPTGVSRLCGEPLSLAAFYYNIPVSHQGAFIKKYIFDEIGLYDTYYSVVADMEWFARFFYQKKYAYSFTGETFAYYETVGHSTKNRMKGLKQMLRYSPKYFPWHVSVVNYIRFPFMWLKVNIIDLIKDTNIYKVYRQQRFGKTPQ
jgi:glycosyltransferase involved in cell wall biosynthesis